MPFFGADFFDAVAGLSHDVIAAYMRAIWHYWNKERCKGLQNDSAFLKRICQIDSEHWDYVMSVVFDNDKFFTIGEDGLWHQRRAFAEWQKADRKTELARAAAAARWCRKKGVDRKKAL